MERSDFHISLAVEPDVRAALAISNDAAERGVANFATEPEQLEDWVQAWRDTHLFHPWLVVRERGRIIGFAKSSPHKGRGAYRFTAEVSVYIDFEHHGKGIGGLLYELLLPMLKAQGYVTVVAGITSGHTPSERLHAKFGFVRCATFHRVGWKFGAYHDVGFWELFLNADDSPPSPVRPVAECWPRPSTVTVG